MSTTPNTENKSGNAHAIIAAVTKVEDYVVNMGSDMTNIKTDIAMLRTEVAALMKKLDAILALKSTASINDNKKAINTVSSVGADVSSSATSAAGSATRTENINVYFKRKFADDAVAYESAKTRGQHSQVPRTRESFYQLYVLNEPVTQQAVESDRQAIKHNVSSKPVEYWTAYGAIVWTYKKTTDSKFDSTIKDVRTSVNTESAHNAPVNTLSTDSSKAAAPMTFVESPNDAMDEIDNL